MDTIFTTLNQITTYVGNRINGFLLRGAPIDEIGFFSWTFLSEILIWNVAHFYVISFILEKWIGLDRRQTLMVLFLLLFWDTVGATLLIMYILHQAFEHLFGNELKLIFSRSGKKTGYSPSATAASSTTARTREMNEINGGNNDNAETLQNENVDGCDEENDDGNMGADTNTDGDESLEDEDGEKEKLSPHKTIHTAKKKETVRSSVSTSNRVYSGEIEGSSPSPPKMKSSTQHPGLKGFHLWMEAITGIYRSFHIAQRDQDGDVYPNNPKSERGRAPVAMTVTNKMMIDIDVFWLDFKAKETRKGRIRRNGGNFQITTWVGHPWIFRDRETGRMLLYYVPYRVIPVIESQLKSGGDRNPWDENDDDDSDTSVGRHDFAIAGPTDHWDLCAVEDELLPFPATRIRTVNRALEFACQQLEREQVVPRVLLKYLHNIMLEPHEPKYRQIRVANKTFFNNVWCNGGRGILEALGFEENGAYIEMGPSEGFLPQDRIKDLASAIIMLDDLAKGMEDANKAKIAQPLGADGSGRALYRDTA